VGPEGRRLTGLPPGVPVRWRVHPWASRISLRVDADGTLVVSVGRRYPKRGVAEFLDANRGWIERTRARVLERARRHPPFAYADGDTLAILGTPVRLDVVPSAGRRRTTWTLRGGYLTVRPADSAAGAGFRPAVRRAVKACCGERLERFAAPLVHRHAAALGRNPGPVRALEFRTQWGSCTAGGRIALDWRLALAPVSLAEYVIAHEACHLAQAGHPPRFWRLMDRLLPDWRVRRKALRDAASELIRY
jgi:predicted metal-dependent hydrolase